MAVIASLAMAFAMALAVFASSANAQGNPNRPCPPGTTEVLKIEGQGPFSETVDVDGTEVTISGTVEGDTITFTTAPPTSLTLVIKAGQNTEVVGPSTGGTFEFGPTDQDISNVKFCFGGGGTTTTTTGTDTTATGTDTTTTGQYTTTTTTTTGTDTTGTDTTGTDTTGTDTTGTDGTTTGATTSATTGATTSVTTGATTSVTTTGDDFEKKYYEEYYYDKDYDKYFYDKDSDKYYYYKDDAAPSVQYEKSPAAVQYEYSAPEDTPKAEGELPETGGSSLLAVGAMVLLLGGGLTALFVVRRGAAG